MRDPRTRSLTVVDTMMSPGAPSAATRAPQLDLAGVEADPHLDPDVPESLADRRRAPDRPGRRVEHREEAVAGRLDLPAAVLLQLATDQLVVSIELVAPPSIADLRRALGRPDDVAEHHGGEDPVGSLDRGERRRRLPLRERADQPARDARREQGVATGDRAHALEQDLWLAVLHQESARADPERLEHVLVLIEGRQDDDHR